MYSATLKSRASKFPSKSSGAKSASTKSPAIIIAAAVVAILVLPTCVWAWMHYRHVSKVQKAKQLLAAAAQTRANQPANSGQWRFGFSAETQQAFDALGLSDAERQEVFRDRWEQAQRRRQEEMDRYVAMSERDRRAYMQKQAADMAKRFDQRAADAAKNGGSAAGASGASGNRSGGPGSQAGGPGGSGGPRGPRSPDQRLQAQKRRLDNTTPEQRAQRTLYYADLTKAIGQQNSIRMQQGLPLIPPPRTRAL